MTEFHFDKKKLGETLRSAGEYDAANVLKKLTPSQWEELRQELQAAAVAQVESAIIVADRIKTVVAQIAESDGIINTARGVMEVSAAWQEAIGKTNPAVFVGLSSKEFADKLLSSLKFETMVDAIKQRGDINDASHT